MRSVHRPRRPDPVLAMLAASWLAWADAPSWAATERPPFRRALEAHLEVLRTRTPAPHVLPASHAP